MRAFVAITLPQPTRAALYRACDAFRESAPDLAGEKWVPAENLHITLQFIGRLEDEAVPLVAEALAKACRPLRPFSLTIGDIAPKPGGRHSRMLWARAADGVEPSRELAAAAAEALTASIGFVPETRTYTPHVTLARFRVPRRAPEDALAAANLVLDALAPACGPSGPAATVVSVPHVSLMSSRLSRSGPTYEEVLKVPLGSD